MIQSKLFHECVLYMLSLLWFMALEQHADVMLYLVIRHLPTEIFISIWNLQSRANTGRDNPIYHNIDDQL